MRNLRYILLLVLALVLTSPACISSGSSGSTGAPSSTSNPDSPEDTSGGDAVVEAEPAGDEPAVDDAGGPVVRLTKITYNGVVIAEFTYQPDGEPLSMESFLPITGESSGKSVVGELDDDGRVVRLDSENSGDYEVRVYDSDGRIAEYTSVREDGTQSITTYSYEGGTATIHTQSDPITYVLDERGNIRENTSVSGGETYTTTYLEYDDAPNPLTMTGGMYPGILSPNNELRHTAPAGCEYITEHTYQDGLVVASHSEGCSELRGTPIVHDWVYEYAEF